MNFLTIYKPTNVSVKKMIDTYDILQEYDEMIREKLIIIKKIKIYFYYNYSFVLSMDQARKMGLSCFKESFLKSVVAELTAHIGSGMVKGRFPTDIINFLNLNKYNLLNYNYKLLERLLRHNEDFSIDISIIKDKYDTEYMFFGFGKL